MRKDPTFRHFLEHNLYPKPDADLARRHLTMSVWKSGLSSRRRQMTLEQAERIDHHR
jgi:hypothetical protein